MTKKKQKFNNPDLFDQEEQKEENMSKKTETDSERQALIDRVREMSEKLKFQPGGTHHKQPATSNQ